MASPSSSNPQRPRLDRLLRYLETDPANQPLLLQAAEAAADLGDIEQAQALIARAAAVASLPPAARNLQGILLLRCERFADAQALFERLRQDGEDSPGIRFNLAWAHAMQDEFGSCLAFLDDEVMAASPRAPGLKVQALHHLRRHDEAMAAGTALAAAYPGNPALLGSLAMVALDAEEPAAARRFAAGAGRDPDGLSVLGILALGDGDVPGALARFSETLAARPRHARALVGQGLALLAAGDPGAGAKAIDRGAEIFADHVGSWVASGWAHYLAGEPEQARTSFERGMAADPGFSEVHGGLAVLDLAAGDADSARKRTDIALRLDRASFGALLAKMMLMDRGGDKAGAERLRSKALTLPTGADGKTLLDALRTFGTRQRR